ncbi:phage terminase small subunit P27 family [Lactiplantibacillus plantarum]|uniref:phage terminase small subunit P27 family n=1 Tax=Lactobacillaceae TaxID=33958 RepID=UPI00136FFA59|nr:phage terminase small subunit P27 family [Lactiplantibacillus plantarum]MYV00131.1 phage terminase small subunit P27 family [Lactiplantibacillus plantarum]
MKIKDLPDEPPKYMEGIARYMWRRIVPMLKENSFANEMDKTLVEALCYNYRALRDSAKSIDEHGTQFETFDYFTDDDGNIVNKELKAIKKNPAVDSLDKATKNIRAISSELGLTPQSRAELLKLSDSDDDDEDSPFGGDDDDKF